MNAGVKAYQSMQKAAKDVSEGKTGAKARLTAATKRYVQHVEKTAKKEADEKIKDAKKRASAAISGTKRKRASATKTKSTSKKRTTTSGRGKSRSATKKRR